MATETVNILLILIIGILLVLVIHYKLRSYEEESRNLAIILVNRNNKIVIDDLEKEVQKLKAKNSTLLLDQKGDSMLIERLMIKNRELENK